MDELDALEAQVAGAARRRRRIIWGIVGIIALIAMTPCAIVTWNIGASIQEASEQRERFSQRATPEQVREVDEATRALEAGVDGHVASWRAAMASSTTLVPRPDLGACPVRLPMRQPASAQRGMSFNNYDSFDAIVFPGGQGFPHAVAHGDVVPVTPPRAALAHERAEDLREAIRREGSVESLDSIVSSARELASFWTYDVVFYAHEWDPPLADATGTSFTGGRASGVAVLYDYASDRVLCAGEVVAESTSTEVEYTAQILQEARSLQSLLDTEFAAEVERAIASGLRYRAGEPLVEAAPEEETQ